MGYSKKADLKGESLPEEKWVDRVKRVRVVLCTKPPLNKFIHMRGLLEENALHLSDRRDMANIVLFVLKKSKTRSRRKSLARSVSN